MGVPGFQGSRYGWFVGVVVVLALAYITLNTVSSKGPGSRGPAAGRQLPPFALPLALGSLAGDANVATRAGEGGFGRRPACSVRGPQILNVCQLAERGPVVLAFFVTRGARCTQQLDRLDALRASFPGVQLAGIAIRGDRQALRRLVRGHHWAVPVGYDRDGALANLYGVAVCPQLTFAYPGGIVMGSTFGQLDAGTLRARLGRLVAASRARGWRSPR